MLFESTYAENLKRLKIKKDLGYISLDERDNCVVSEIEKKIAKKSGVPRDQIKFYSNKVEYDENCYEDRLIFYHEVTESDAEYAKRLEKLECKDITTFLDVLARFNNHVRGKAKLKKVFDRISEKYPGIIPHWEHDLVKQFFSTKSTEELVQEAFEKGLRKVRKIPKRS
jgi:hypothetical protein